ncbi:Receptor-type guanylate cyclase gcy [Seminavis robusta]|uniref:Receptor-type guanylate cyclase gcy n=1 Tax=Seminavis robusta TaxID=568900 RepID=A0A9N8D9T8_9STRA|nr:Receptor-type guanylate cyclase gcy [Seminavis robusta]|eukprot:Sro6_g005510.1 Receptor-type guanylate cyclase gcy (1158) ;mRNA; r:212985-218405
MSSTSLGDDDSTSCDGDTESGQPREEFHHEDENEKKLREELTKRETKVVWRLRVVVILVLMATPALVCTLVYMITRGGESEEFKSQYEGASRKVLTSWAGILHEMRAVSGLGVASISHATDTESKWPFVTLTNFQQRAGNARQLSGALMVSIAPRVTFNQVEEWDDFVQGKDSYWIDEGLAFQEELGLNGFEYGPNIEKSHVTDRKVDLMHSFDESGAAVLESSFSEYYLPVWMTSPVLRTGLVNENQLSRTNFSVPQTEIASIVLDEEYAVIGGFTAASPGSIRSPSKRTALFATLRSIVEGKEVEYLGDPMANVYMPVFDSFNTTTRKAVAMMTAIVHWRSYFRNILPDNVNGIDVVLDNSCDGFFTYQIHGDEAFVVGVGDHHNPKFDEWRRDGFIDGSILHDGTASGLKLHKDGCQYSIHLYPSQAFYDKYNTDTPLAITCSIAAVFLFTIAMFLLYDRIVERRQQVVLAKATQSTAIVSSLFPKSVRDRLIEADPATSVGNKTTRLKGFLDGATTHGQNDEKPIADLFPDCTVFFADIAGFTAWSSTREPSQVFILLQAVYQSFDVLAKRRNVFKVETIGDSYMACTGIPEPQENHAAIMVKFAWDCMIKMSEVTKELESQLGPDTGSLEMRFGLHSGPVTAGVLRGDRARFQLFGDTVNYASRMESTGCRAKIQVSQATASILKQSGKEHWLQPRDDAVKAKGLGCLNTFWANPTNRRGSSSILSSSIFGGDSVQTPKKEIVQPVNKRLVDWMVDLLKDNLQKLVHTRNQRGEMTSSSEDVRWFNPGAGETCLDEVKECIGMPKYNAKTAVTMSGYKDCTIDPAVVENLRDYVTRIASLYQAKNCFHNFEHACHVTLSVSKLLKRVVSPDLKDHELKKLKKSSDLASHLHDYTHGIASDALTCFAICFAALTHDVDHRGVSNTQLAKEEPDMASKYANKSIAEQHSVDLAWIVLMDGRFLALRRCLFPTQGDLLRFRQLVVNVVLATDIFDKELGDLRKSRWERAFSGEVKARDQSKISDLRATIVIEYIIQASDVCHTMQHWHVYRKWNERLFQEMYQAYTEGRMGKDPSTFWYMGEIGFFDNYIIPLAKRLKECGVFGVSGDEYLTYAIQNRNEWKERGEEIVKELVAQVKGDSNRDSLKKSQNSRRWL